MPSFDTVSEVDLHEVSNAVDQANREIGNRYDFKGSGARVVQAEDQLSVQADNEFQLNQVKDILHLKLAKRGVDLGSLEEGKLETTINQARQTVRVQQGIPQDIAKRIVKLVKDTRLKVQASVQGDKVRVSGKNRDDLQKVIAVLRDAAIDLPLQYTNFRD